MHTTYRQLMPGNRHRRRSGSILVLAVFLLTATMAILALSVDIGYVHSAKAQMQRSADAAALAGAWELLEGISAGQAQTSSMRNQVVNESATFSASNNVGPVHPVVSSNDVTIGHLQNLANTQEPISTTPGNSWNAVRVVVHRTHASNGEIPLFFARTLGLASLPQTMEATAAFWPGVKGFKTPPNGGNLGILPFALDQVTWDGLMNGVGSDNFSYNPQTGVVTAGQDHILEVNLFPQGTGSPGNRGTVDIGSPGNSTADIKRQILDGISPSDLSYMGGKLELNQNGQLPLNGDTGISAAVKDQLSQIMGQPRVIPVFQTVAGNGNNAMYTIVKFVGIRIVEVNLTGKLTSKRVMVQPAAISLNGAIPSASSTVSNYVYTPVTLIR